MNKFLIPVFASILFLGGIGLSQDAFATDYLIGDGISCTSTGGIWSDNTCTLTNFVLEEDEILAPLNDATLVLINVINNGEIDVDDGNVQLEGTAEGEGLYFVDDSHILTNNGDLILDGEIIVSDNGNGTVVNTVDGTIVVTDAGAVTIEVGFLNNFGTISIEGGSIELFAGRSLEINSTTEPGIFNNFGTLEIDFFESQIMTEAGLDGLPDGLLYNDGNIDDITTETGELFGEFLNEGTVQEDCNSVISVVISGNPTVDVCLPSDTVPPIITLLGNDPETVDVGTVYLDAGAVATDDVDGDITANIVIGRLPLDTSVIGSIHIVTYDVTDAAGNTAIQVTRTVTVIDIDSDGDGVVDGMDICPGGDDNIDTDTDGIPDFCDSTPNGEATIPASADISNKNVVIGNNLVVGENVVINKDTVIGNQVTIGDDTEIAKDALIGDNVSIGSDTIIAKNIDIANNVTIGTGVTIEKDVTIGTGVTIGNDVTIEKNVTILAGTFVPDGTTITKNTTFP